MSAIAGFWRLGGQPDAAARCQHLLVEQSVYGPHDRNLVDRGDFAAGRCLYRLLPEDAFDRQPLVSEDGRFTLVADLRIDNREELIAGLRLGSIPDVSDAELLFRACLAWGRGALERTIGDFAFAMFDARKQVLLLARDTAGERPLHYRRGAGFFAFASMAPALARLPGSLLDVDEERLAGFVADLPPPGGRSFFAEVGALRPGHCVTVTPAGLAEEPYWEPDRRPLHFARPDDYGDALREQIDAAVARRLRRAGGSVAAQLSAGFDSAAVATSAALALATRGETLLAFTAAPREGFAAPVLAGRIGDESPIAAATVALHPNVEHRIVRPSGGSPLDLLESGQRLAGQPVTHVMNNLWWQAIGREAAASGATVMLTGEAGNFTISAGRRLETLADLVRTGAWSRWRHEAGALRRGGEFGWLNLLGASLGPWLPGRLHARLRGRRFAPPAFVAPAWRDAMRRRLEASRPSGPARDSKARRRAMLRTADPGPYRKRSLAEWGIDERDPTNDRRLVDFCFSLPPEALLRDGVRRPALRRALDGRVAPAMLGQTLRGYQMADWYERIDGREVLAFARQVAVPGLAGSVVDLAAVEAAAQAWPTAGWHELAVIRRFRELLLRSLGAAQFVNQVRSGGLG